MSDGFHRIFKIYLYWSYVILVELMRVVNSLKLYAEIYTTFEYFNKVWFVSVEKRIVIKSKFKNYFVNKELKRRTNLAHKRKF